ncbi:type IV toxin-antitoxin system AbiEi family antitoxin domain-containing protein [Nocardioides zeae]
MHSRLRALDAEQGYFLTRDALALGYTAASFYRAKRAGQVVPIRHGTYALPDSWARLTEAQRHLVRLRASLERATARHVASHTSAVLLHTEGHWGLDLSHVHLTNPLRRAERRESGLTHHRATLPEEHVTEVGGLPTVVPARAAVELSTLVDTERTLVVMDSLRREGRTTKPELDAMIATACAWPGTLHTALAGRLASPLSGSVGESRTMYAFFRGGVPARCSSTRCTTGAGSSPSSTSGGPSTASRVSSTGWPSTAATCGPASRQRTRSSARRPGRIPSASCSVADSSATPGATWTIGTG